MRDHPRKVKAKVLRCRDMSELASEYLDHRLPLHRRLAVRLHLSICTACTNYYAQMRKTIALLRGLPSSPPPAETEERVLAALRSPQGGSPAE